MKTIKPIVFHYRKWGHLWQSAIGLLNARALTTYGYGTTKALATKNAHKRWNEFQKNFEELDKQTA